MRVRSGLPVALAITLSSALLAGCSTAIAGLPAAGDDAALAGVDPTFIKGTDSGSIDQLAAMAINDVLEYWRGQYQPTFGATWQELRGGFYSVDTTDPTATPPPCASKTADVEGNAFYCPTADSIAWDRSALLPVLQDKFGDAAVVVVLAHEIGHAVHHRAGIGVAEQRGQPERFPTILTEAMADCYAGSFVRWVTDSNAPHVRMDTRQLDNALGALVTFRDPVGTSQADPAAHGNAFDRVSAFQDGFRNGPKLCAAMSLRNRQFTLRNFINRTDRVNGGNLGLDDMVASITEDLNRFFEGVVVQRGRAWQPPVLRAEPGSCPAAEQGPIAFCANGAADGGAIVVVGKSELTEVHREIGDYAIGTLLASRQGLAALAMLGQPAEGRNTGRVALCLAGAYTGSMLSRTQGFLLSPGDLDEAVQVLLSYDYASRNARGTAIPTGFQRVDVFRNGTLNGLAACGLG